MNSNILLCGNVKRKVTNTKGILAQFEIYDRMVKTRIRLQKLMQLAALLPKYNKIALFNSRSSEGTRQVGIDGTVIMNQVKFLVFSEFLKLFVKIFVFESCFVLLFFNFDCAFYLFRI